MISKHPTDIDWLFEVLDPIRRTHISDRPIYDCPAGQVHVPGEAIPTDGCTRLIAIDNITNRKPVETEPNVDILRLCRVHDSFLNYSDTPLVHLHGIRLSDHGRLGRTDLGHNHLAGPKQLVQLV